MSSHSWQETYVFIVRTRQQWPGAEGSDFEAVFVSDIMEEAQTSRIPNT